MLLYAFPLRLLLMPRRQSQNMAERYAGQIPQKMAILLPSPMQSYFPHYLSTKAMCGASPPRHVDPNGSLSNLSNLSHLEPHPYIMYHASKALFGSGCFSMLFHSVCSQCRGGSPHTWPNSRQARHPRR